MTNKAQHVTTQKSNILVVDDDYYVITFFESLLKEEGYSVATAANGEQALKIVAKGGIDHVILDLKMPGINGMSVLDIIKKDYPDITVTIITGFGTIDTAIQAMKMGADDYFTKPFEHPEEILISIQRSLKRSNLEREVKYLKESLKERYQFNQIIGKSKPMLDLYDLLERISPTDSNVLIMGESGTGKELVASTIHYNSPRRDKKFQAVNCGALTETLLTSELFGHEKGAFTGALKTKQGIFEEANGGTVFLDEIGNTSPSFQVKLLRVLQEKQFERVGGLRTIEIDVRIIAASNIDLKEAMLKGDFRDDLFYRLSVMEIRLTPLRERTEDIPLLAQHFLENHLVKGKTKVKTISREAMGILIDYKWRGNVRELRNVLERAMILAEGEEIRPADLASHLFEKETHPDIGIDRGIALDYREAKADFERRYLRVILNRSGGNISKAARMAGLPRQTVHMKMKKYGIRRE